jgi:proteasome lid subunit RPN8/RPN11
MNEHDIVATFHTHPNTGSDYLQEPSETDRRAVQDDPDLKGEFYVGEFVIAQETIYLIAPSGQVSEVGDTKALLFSEGD